MHLLLGDGVGKGPLLLTSDAILEPCSDSTAFRFPCRFKKTQLLTCGHAVKHLHQDVEAVLWQ